MSPQEQKRLEYEHRLLVEQLDILRRTGNSKHYHMPKILSMAMVPITLRVFPPIPKNTN